MGQHGMRNAGARVVGAVVVGVLAAANAWVGVGSAAVTPVKPTLDGFLRVAATTEKSGQTKVFYRLETTDGIYALKLPVVPNVTPRQRKTIRKALRIAADERVRVTGKHSNNLDRTFIVHQVEVLPPLPADPTEPPPLTTRPRRFAFVVVKWQGQGSAGVPDPGAVAAWAFNGPTSLAGYYRAVSNNMIQISGDVITATLPNDTGGANDCTPLRKATVGAKNIGLTTRLATYDNVVFVSQYTGTAQCGTIGVAYVNGREGLVNGAWTTTDQRFTFVTAHEVGHEFGLMHAGFAACGTVPLVDECLGETGNYGDPYDAMGAVSLAGAHFSAIHKVQLGVYPPGAVVTADRSGTYTMRASDAPGIGGVRLVQIPIGSTGQAYGLEVRGLAPLFAPYTNTDQVTNGVSIRLFAANHTPVLEDDDTVLVDASPASAGGGRSSALTVGNTWSDPSAGITIKTLQAGWGWATVHITRP